MAPSDFRILFSGFPLLIHTFSTEPIKKPENKYYLYSAFKSFR